VVKLSSTGLMELAIAYVIMIGLLGGYVKYLFSKLNDLEYRINAQEDKQLNEESE
jgi:hypothetical protein|tara:strand:+ start:2705 stop:2869 length:165 start_codon:yes stop_codon:yes gene_type:complete